MESGLLDFLGQLPPVMIVMFCGSGILLLVSISYFVSSRGRKADALAVPNSASSYVSASSSDMPDLDLLLGNNTPTQSPSPRSSSSPAARPAGGGTYSVTLTDGRTIEAAEALTIGRDLADGSLIIQIGGRAYSSAAQITDEEVRRRFTNIVRDLAKQLQEAPKAVAEPPVEIPTALVDTPPQPATPPPTYRPAPTNSKAPLPGDLPKYDLNEPLPVKKGRGKQESQPIPELNIADAIESYLQYKLVRTPEFDGRSIHVLPAFDGGVKIEVDGTYYEGVGDIQDTQVREFLAATIEEWQSRQ